MACRIPDDDTALFLDWAIARSKEIAEGKGAPLTRASFIDGEIADGCRSQLTGSIAIAMTEGYDMPAVGGVELLQD